ncbi:unnamed protein product [Phytophthora fragariaefolia]|uniref:Unnamed protein product n=1 Tax=Phytophthora fragariaefolia TaxID=1490495 RepID=A0A9W6YHT2_9STRA|nr:unnamed protein product [Phytophthora fragariaefolia]
MASTGVNEGVIKVKVTHVTPWIASTMGRSKRPATSTSFYKRTMDDEEVEDGSLNIQESGSNEEAVGQDLLELVDFEWCEIDLDAQAMFTLDANGSISDVDHESNEERVENQADSLGSRGGVNDRRICLCSLEDHVGEDKTYGYSVEPGTKISSVLPAKNPFPVDLLDDDDDEDTTNDDHTHNNAFEYKTPHSVDANPSTTGSDSNSADEYHPSEFNSESGGSDDDYHLGDD